MRREARDFGEKAARGDSRAMRDIATGKVPLMMRGYTPGSKVISTTGKVLKADAYGQLPSKATLENYPPKGKAAEKRYADKLRAGKKATLENWPPKGEAAEKRYADKLRAGKKGAEASKVGTKAFREKMNKQQLKHPPNPKAPAKSIAQTRNANVVNQFFGGSKSVPKGGGGGFGQAFTQGTGNPVKKKN